MESHETRAFQVETLCFCVIQALYARYLTLLSESRRLNALLAELSAVGALLEEQVTASAGP